MSKAGTLTRQNLGFSIPVDAPLYQSFPVYYRDAEVISVKYVTNREAVLPLLPCKLKVPKEPEVTCVFAHYPMSSVGAYDEVAQVVACTYESREVLYAVRFHVTTATAMAAGREIGGFPKKVGHIEYEVGETYECRLEHPRGLIHCSGSFRPRTVTPVPAGVVAREYVGLRVIPGRGDVTQPALAQLVGTRWELGPGESWTGDGSVYYTGASALDPYDALPVVKPLDSTLFIGSLVANDVTFVEDL